MAATEQNLSMWVGDDIKNLIYTLTQDGEPYDLDSCTIIWAMSLLPTMPVLIEKTTDNGITINPPSTDGIFTVVLLAADTINIPAGRYYYEAQVTDAFGSSRIVVTGTVTLNASNLTDQE